MTGFNIQISFISLVLAQAAHHPPSKERHREAGGPCLLQPGAPVVDFSQQHHCPTSSPETVS